jgi:phosphoribosylformimino-5-aminoimidazole carboxamide ribotide isomerase
MQIIPAIDLLGGECVRLTKGSFSKRRVYSVSPEEVALSFKRQGARRLHVVDLDGAKKGRPVNLGAAVRIGISTGLPVELGGGMRTLAAVRRALRRGIDTVILGTAAFANPRMLKRAVADHGARIAVSLDLRGGRVAVKGWRSRLDMTGPGAIRWLAGMGVRRIVYTDTDRDGTLRGVNVRGIKAVLEECSKNGMTMIFAGGVRDIKDIRKLRKLDPAVLRGAVSGKALYEGTLDLAKAVKAIAR